MPGTTRYSATFDRPYEEDDKTDPSTTNGSRRPRSQSLAHIGLSNNSRPYTPLGHYGGDNSRPSQRSSSTDSGGKGAEQIPTRATAKPVVKAHNNPFQFVKVGTCPLYRKAEEQLKVVKEVKKPPEALKEEEEWQSNLDSWKSRRRKMSEDIFRRQEEIKQFETEEQSVQAGSKKIKKFSEMVESRAHRGRTMSLCLLSSPLDLQQWELNNQNKNNLFSEESEEHSAANSDDEGSHDQVFQKTTNGSTNGNRTPNSRNSSAKSKSNKLFELGENGSPSKDGIYIDSGLESISSSHRTGDTPDSCSDFSQDSGSSIDCDSPRASSLLHGINILEDYSSKFLHHSDSSDSFSNLKTSTPDLAKKPVNGQTNKSSLKNGNASCLPPNQSTNGCSNSELLTNELFSKKKENSTESSVSELSSEDVLENFEKDHSKHEQSIESENEVFVDDFGDSANSPSLSNVTTEEEKNKIPLNATLSCTTDSSDSVQTENSACAAVHTISKTISKSTLEKSKIEENCNSKLPVSNEEILSVKSEMHSKEIEKEPTSVKKKNTVKIRKKKPIAKVVSVEISNQQADISADSKKASVENAATEESLNVVFQSPPKDSSQKPAINDTKTKPSSARVTLTDVLPVEQIAEEMEKLILQQLEEEERAKEISSKVSPISAATFDISPPTKAEPPKEKPPPPPCTEEETPNQKVPSLKRVNSTKRIKKEIHKRRSNFLGIENADENILCDNSLVPPPNALEQILKAEMELDRESMKRLENAAAERVKLEEKEFIKREQEIIANLEKEEMHLQFVTKKESIDNSMDGDRILKLKEEKIVAETEKAAADDQILRLAEEKLLREREEYIRKQEEDIKSSAELSPPLLSDAAKSLNASSLCTETILLSETGEGKTISDSQVLGTDDGKMVAPAKPAVPPKPVKKKEAIRKERERLRQEQEELQKEREEHRLKLLKEQDLLKNSQKPNAPVCRPTPPAKPSHTPKLTHSSNPPQPSARENVIFSSQSYHMAQNGISSRNGCVEMDPVLSKHKPVPSQKKNIHSDSRAPQKVPLAKKTSQDSSPESKYNQNHWLIQEAEMRRIAELKERQHSAQFSQSHLVKDDLSNPRLSIPKQDKMWSYAQPSIVTQKHHVPPSEKLLGMYQQVPQPPAKPSRVVPLERPEQILSISGRKKCSHCMEELGRGAAMIIESLQLYYHIQCFQCCVCQAQLGNGSCGTDVRVRNNKLHCQNCYSNDEAGLKFSQV
ncbi:hypothetical protein JTE90_022109 [Oedothorax gibbosus]|uniref:LIM zinc-binding domain-containing protein n=1 Tax=Oedothorax gibbosus TaxID=931172 RepID=A0AAV6VV20_9ARAC|nr:hypothetical protein JTE90_022109 [Oedothorax gibbosus]